VKRILTPLLAVVLALTVALSPAVAKTPPGPSALAIQPVVDAHLGYQKQRTCSPSAKPGTRALLDLLIRTWGGSSWGISRSCGIGGTSEHKEGRALDWHKDTRYASHRAAVADVVKWLTANNGEVAYRLGIMYIIWDQKIWSIYYQELGWRKMDSRGSRTGNHKDHVHISLSWDGAMKQTSWWTGAPITKPLNSACGVNGARACLPTIRRASDVWSGSGVTVPPFLPAPWTIPGIGGSAQVGRTMTAVAGTWVPSGATVSYEWLADGNPIVWATKQQYVVQPGTIGKTLRVRVTAVTTGGTRITKTSDGTNDVLRANFRAAPAPVVSGPRSTGSTLSIQPVAWDPVPTTLRYQWYRGSTRITGATASSYRLTASDLGKRITARVTGSAYGYNTKTVATKTTVAITKGYLPTAPTPSLSGALVVGGTLTAIRGNWGPAPVTYSYQWYRDDQLITSATAKTYLLTPDDLGAVIRVRVRGVNPGYLYTVRWSVPGAAVTGPTVPPTMATQPDPEESTVPTPSPSPTPTPTLSPSPTPTPSPTVTTAGSPTPALTDA